MPATTGLMTVDEFRQLPETGRFYYELRHGELVQVTRPRLKHVLIQKRLLWLLEEENGRGVSGVDRSTVPTFAGVRTAHR